MDECTVSALNVKVNVRRVIITEVKDQRSSRLVVVFLFFFSELCWMGKNSLSIPKKKKKRVRHHVYKELADASGKVMKETSRHFFKIYFYWTINEYYKMKASVVFVVSSSVVIAAHKCRKPLTFMCVPLSNNNLFYVILPFYTSCFTDCPLYKWTAPHFPSLWKLKTLSASLTFLARRTKQACISSVCRSDSVGLILLVWSFSHMHDTFPKAIHSSDMNEGDK